MAHEKYNVPLKKKRVFNRVCNFAKQIFFIQTCTNHLCCLILTFLKHGYHLTITLIFPIKDLSPKPPFRSRIEKWDVVFDGNIVPVIGILETVSRGDI